jgi:hypothetical protein
MANPLFLLAALLLPAGALFAEPMSALQALKLLPPGAAGRLARIEAHEGQPLPERWHLLVHDPKEENGLHEYVVAGGEVVASRAISQFAESLAAEDVFGEAVKIDSDRAAKLAQQFAQANKLTFASLNFELKKAGEGAVPLWKVTCVGSDGKPFGHVVLTATRGTVVAHDGFPAEPPAMLEKTEKPKVPPGSQLARAGATATPAPERKADGRRTEVAALRPPVEASPEPATVEEMPIQENRPGFLRRAGGSIQRIFTGR